MSKKPAAIIEDTKYYTTEQMCVRNHCHRSTLQRKEQQGIIPPHVLTRIGKSNLYVRSQVHAFERKREPQIVEDEALPGEFQLTPSVAKMEAQKQREREQETHEAREREREARNQERDKDREIRERMKELAPQPEPTPRAVPARIKPQRQLSVLNRKKVKATLKANKAHRLKWKK